MPSLPLSQTPSLVLDKPMLHCSRPLLDAPVRKTSETSGSRVTIPPAAPPAHTGLLFCSSGRTRPGRRSAGSTSLSTAATSTYSFGIPQYTLVHAHPTPYTPVICAFFSLPVWCACNPLLHHAVRCFLLCVCAVSVCVCLVCVCLVCVCVCAVCAVYVCAVCAVCAVCLYALCVCAVCDVCAVSDSLLSGTSAGRCRRCW